VDDRALSAGLPAAGGSPDRAGPDRGSTLAARIAAARLPMLAAIAALTLALPALFILLAGRNPLETAWTLLHYTLATFNGFTEVLVYAGPLTLIGLGAAVAFRSGIWNIGGESQLVCGAVLAVALAVPLARLGPAGLWAFLAVGCIGGGLAGALVGWLRARYQANEIIVTIMFNYVAVQLLTWVNRGPLQESMHIFPRSNLIADSLQLPILFAGSRVHGGLLIALAAAVLTHLLMVRTAFGFRIRVLGENPEVADYAGLGRTRIAITAMFVSGALAGLAGACEIGGIHHRLEDGFAEGYGMAGIAVALMARLNALAVPLAAIVFGVFYAGAGVLQRDAGIPFPIVWIIQGAVIFAFLAFDWAARAARGGD